MNKFIELQVQLPTSDRVLVYLHNDEIQAVLPLAPDQILISYSSMIEMLERAGYEVRKK